MQESRPARPHSEHADRSAAADAGLDAFRRWLGCPEGQESVRQFVRQTAQDDDRTQLDDTVQDFNAFILEQILAHPTRHPFLFQWNWPEQPLQMLRYCWKTFARQRRDRLRSKGRNLKKYLYRRLRAIVADDDELASWVSPDRSFTCFHGQGLDPSRLRRPAAGDRLLRTVAVPLPAGDRVREISREEYLRRVARWYWRRVCELHGPRLVPIQDVVAALAATYAWIDHSEVPLEPDLEPPDRAAPRPEEETDRRRLCAAMTALAHHCAALLSADHCCLLWYRLQTPTPSYRDIAERLELSSQDRAKRLLSQCLERIRKFTTALPDEVQKAMKEREKQTFLAAVQEECAKRHFCP